MKRLCTTISTLVAFCAVSGMANADGVLEFKVPLTGAQEVPATPPLIPSGIDTSTTGEITVTFNRDRSESGFQLVVNGGAGVTVAHFHCGRPGQNGPVVAVLFDCACDGVDVDGELGAATLTNANFELSAAECDAAIGRPVNNIASLAFAARDGLIYANVHTAAHDAGEVRGQLELQDLDQPILEQIEEVGAAARVTRAKVEVIDENVQQTEAVARRAGTLVEVIDENVRQTEGVARRAGTLVEVIGENVKQTEELARATRGQVQVIDENVKQTEAVARRTLNVVQ